MKSHRGWMNSRGEMRGEVGGGREVEVFKRAGVVATGTARTDQPNDSTRIVESRRWASSALYAPDLSSMETACWLPSSRG